MLYKLLFCVGSLIILLFLTVTYYISLKNVSKINLRQKLYKVLIIIAYISIIMDMTELIFYYNGPDFLY